MDFLVRIDKSVTQTVAEKEDVQYLPLIKDMRYVSVARANADRKWGQGKHRKTPLVALHTGTNDPARTALPTRLKAK